jgi:hypothetical protein
MSLNDGITQKQRGRAELEALVAAFQQSGDTVHAAANIEQRPSAVSAARATSSPVRAR